jgi:hypothetical protein
MKKSIVNIFRISVITCIIFVLSNLPLCAAFKVVDNINSPNKNIVINFLISDKGEMAYNVIYKNITIIDTSTLGFLFKDMPPIAENLKVIGKEKAHFNNNWEMPIGERQNIKNNYNKMTIFLMEENEPGRKINVVFRAYNDGIGFRYNIPKQNNLKEVHILEENTTFKLTGDHEVWWIPADWDSYEHLYNHTKFSEIDALQYKDNPTQLAASYIPKNAVETPVTMKINNNLYLSFHEAALVDYSSMTLKINKDNLSMKSFLVGTDRRDYKVNKTVPFNTPWRSIQISETPGGLVESNLILNLNEPQKIKDVSWIMPMKYVGIWWMMHIGLSTWDYAGTQDMETFLSTTPTPTGKHGATTENAKKYIDFASANNIKGVLVEGWNVGWEYWRNEKDREHSFDFVTPYPDYDLEEVVRYAKSRGVEIIMHHETSSSVENYEKHQDEAYGLMKSLDLHSVKSGYVGPIIPRGEYHHGQYMVNHYVNTAKKAANYKIAMDVHEPIKPTGLRRTYPNLMSAEGARGQEFNSGGSLGGGNPPDHITTLVYTRLLAGPMDFTPGIFDIKLTSRKSNPNNGRVPTTLAGQLSLYVVLYSPVQMAADLVENYEGHPAFQFIRDVPVNWEETKVLNGEIGKYITIARKDRNSDNWFIGSKTNEEPRNFTIKLDFLDPIKRYTATIYEDTDNSDWQDNPTDYNIRKVRNLTRRSQLNLHLAPGGGAAISIMKQ